MQRYWVKTPQWLKKFYPRDIAWEMPVGEEPAVYLTFDDGPHPVATSFVLAQLARVSARATFFCVGNNVSLHPELYAQLLNAGHATGNHTFDHINGWNTNNFTYIKNINAAAQVIQSRMFRPPYGRIKHSQARKLLRTIPSWKIYMWDILSGDFDKNISPQQCAENVLAHVKPGSIVVFHDSEKCFERMSFALPLVLDHCLKKGWKLNALPG